VANTEDPRDAIIREQAALIVQLQATVARLEARIGELEARLRLNSGNSSKPPSSDGPRHNADFTGLKTQSKKKRGGQPGHKGHSREIMDADATVRYEPSSCSGCGSVLGESATAAADGALWQVAELPKVKAHVTSHVAAGRVCSCGRISHGVIPASILAHGYGPRFGAFVSLLLVRYGLSRRDVAQLSSDLLGLAVSASTVCSLASEMGKSLESAAAEALQVVRAEPVVHADETGWRINKVLAWLWVVVGCRATVFLTHAHRNKEAAQALLGSTRRGILVTDRYGAYNDIPLQKRQFCLAHVLRDAQAMIERGGAATSVGEGLAASLRSGIGHFHHYINGAIDRAALIQEGAHERAKCRDILDAALSLGKALDKKTRGICKRLRSTEIALWTFLRIPGVEPTNNAAEQAIRPAVIIRKTSFGSDTTQGAVYFARALSAMESLQRQARDVFIFFEHTLVAARHGFATPSFVAPLAH